MEVRGRCVVAGPELFRARDSRAQSPHFCPQPVGNQTADYPFLKREIQEREKRHMASKILVLALSVLLSALLGTATTAFAQSQRNYGPNGPATGDTFGEPYSGTAAAFIGIITPIGITDTDIADARFRYVRCAASAVK
jgi:hypothetical protein